ncbi:MAG: CBS domain-containing protein, partial [Rhizomicrobium sp.]
TLPAAMSVAEAAQFFAEAERHKSYPVVEETGRVSAMVSRADVLRWIREGWTAGETLGDLDQEMVTAFPDELAGALADRMAQSGASRVPVVARGTGELLGLVARRELLRVRALALRAEHDREGAVALPG